MLTEKIVNLFDYGFTSADFAAAENIKLEKKIEDFIPARVIESQKNRYRVICEYGELSAEIKGSFYYTIEEREDFPVVGDFVLIKPNDQGASLIGEVLPRRSKFSRSDFSGHAQGFAKNILEQTLVSNFDFVFILSSLNQDLNQNRLLRYVASAWQSGGFPVIVLTKADICDDYEVKAKKVRKLNPTVPVVCISSKTGFGLEGLEPFLEPAKTLIFLGSSGVGKSSLLNRLAGKELMEVKAIREDDSKGRHTTTHRELFRLPDGALVIDTPGMRELGLWDAGDGISQIFADIEELFSQCRFSDCTHQSEPGCAVLSALENGSLSRKQWNKYLMLQKETAFVENHSAYLQQKRARFKSIALKNRGIK